MSNQSPFLPADAAPLVIIGASARAAAASAVRAGFQPVALDSFADLDTQRMGPVQQISPYPEGLVPVLQDLPSSSVMYVGALENSLNVLSEVERHHALWGVDSQVISQVRNPQVLQDVQKLARAPVLDWRPFNDPPAPDGTWMLKPLASSGGRGIRIWNSETAAQLEADGQSGDQFFFQQRIQGVPYSGVFIAGALVGDVNFIGVTRQLIGEEALGAGENIWCGNIGPATLSVQIEHLVRRIGNILKWKVGLKGIFGVDFLVDQDQQPWVTEVNPRYPASTELLEWATGECLLWKHARCFDGGSEQPPEWRGEDEQDFYGKAVVYAPSDTTIPDFTPEWAAISDPWTYPQIADIPAPGSVVPQGAPLCTVFAMESSYDSCHSRLLERAADVRSAFGCD
ncbi:MAG: ATP-grasp domain-containing protein [Planctomycetaceae bacterium]|nr:ATP-grasp domain-containing protein [Planctomycetaceae bacterium]